MDDRIAKVVALHCPEAIQDGMVYEVWEDGEITLTKGGDLYRHRNLHCIATGDARKALPVDALPMFNGKHSCIACRSDTDAKAARIIILGKDDGLF